MEKLEHDQIHFDCYDFSIALLCFVPRVMLFFVCCIFAQLTVIYEFTHSALNCRNVFTSPEGNED